MYPELEQCLKKGAGELGVFINEEKNSLFIKYYTLLLEENQKYNLTSIVDEKGVAIKHFVDSLTCLELYDFKNKYVADIGSGAGFPGIPLKIMCEGMNIVLADSVQKKAGFMEKAVRELKLEQTVVIQCRAEDMGVKDIYREKFDTVLSRAVAPLNVLLEYCLPLLKVEGIFLAMKGPAADEEAKKAALALDKLGAVVEKTKTVKLPLLGDERNIVVIKKTRPTSVKYPRRAGLPSKKPL